MSTHRGPGECEPIASARRYRDPAVYCECCGAGEIRPRCNCSWRGTWATCAYDAADELIAHLNGNDAEAAQILVAVDYTPTVPPP